MTLLDRDTMLQHRPPRYEDVPVPELATAAKPDAVVRIQALSGTAIDRFLASLWTADGKYNRQDYAAKLVVLAAVDEKGERLFRDEHTPAVGLLDGAIVQRLALTAERLSGLQAKQVEIVAGN